MLRHIALTQNRLMPVGLVVKTQIPFGLISTCRGGCAA